MDKHYEDRQFAHAFAHAQMMQNNLKRKRIEANLEQTSREIELDKRLFAAQEKIRKERALVKEMADESAESLAAVIVIALQVLALAVVGSVLFWVFIAFSGI